MANYTIDSITSPSILEVGDIIYQEEYDSFKSIDLSNFKVKVELWGDNNVNESDTSKGYGGYTYATIDTSLLENKVFTLGLRTAPSISYGKFSDYSSCLYHRLLVAGAAGQGTSEKSGGNGGGVNGGFNGSIAGGRGGSQTSGGTSMGNNSNGEFGYGAGIVYRGGDGWYGGGAGREGGLASSPGAGGGGSGFIIGQTTTIYPEGYLGDDTELQTTLASAISDADTIAGGTLENISPIPSEPYIRLTILVKKTFEYELQEDGTYFISKVNFKDLSNIVIPSEYEGKKVSGIKANTFINYQNINTLKIPNTITFFGENCFYGTKIEKVEYLGNINEWCSITFSDNDANPIQNSKLFIENSLVTDIVIDSALIKEYSFYNYKYCNSLTVTGESFVDRRAFSNSNLKSIYMRGQISLEELSFESCYLLETIDISNIVYIGTGAFRICSSLRTANITGMLEIPQSLFFGCTKLIYTVPESVSKINTHSLSEINNVSFEKFENIRYIADRAFTNSQTPTHLDISTNVEYIGEKAFYGTTTETASIPFNSIESSYEVWNPNWDLLDSDGNRIQLNVRLLRSIINRYTDNKFKNTKALVFNGTKWVPLDARYKDERFIRINGGKKIYG